MSSRCHYSHAYAEYLVERDDGEGPFSQRVLEHVKEVTAQVYGCYDAPGSGVETRCVLFEFSQGLSLEQAKRIVNLWMEPWQVSNESFLVADGVQREEWVVKRQARVVGFSHGLVEARFGRAFALFAEPLLMVQVVRDHDRYALRPRTRSKVNCVSRGCETVYQICVKSEDENWEGLEEYKDIAEQNATGEWTLFFVGETGKRAMESFASKWSELR
jgi:hypothetical protein